MARTPPTRAFNAQRLSPATCVPSTSPSPDSADLHGRNPNGHAEPVKRGDLKLPAPLETLAYERIRTESICAVPRSPPRASLTSPLLGCSATVSRAEHRLPPVRLNEPASWLSICKGGSPTGTGNGAGMRMTELCSHLKIWCVDEY